MPTEQPVTAEEVSRPPGPLLAQVFCVYAALLALLTGMGSSSFFAFTGPLPVPLQLAVHVATALVVALGTTWLFARRDASPRRTLGLEPQPVASVVGFGAIGFLMSYAGSSTLALTYLAISRTRVQDLLAERGPVLELFAKTPLLMVLPLALVVGFYEEVVFRGFVLGRLRHAFRAWAHTPRAADATAVVLSAVLFGTLHAYQGWYGVFQTTGAGLGLGALAVWRRSIWPSIVAHAAVDALGLFALHVLMPMAQKLLHGAHP